MKNSTQETKEIVNYHIESFGHTVSETLSDWPAQGKTTVSSFLTEPEISIFQRALKDSAFWSFQEWCSAFRRKTREVKKMLDRGGVDPLQFREAFLRTQASLVYR